MWSVSGLPSTSFRCCLLPCPGGLHDSRQLYVSKARCSAG